MMDQFTIDLSEKIVGIILQGPPLPSLVYASAATILVEQWNIVSEKTSHYFFDCDRCFFYNVISQLENNIYLLPISDVLRMIMLSISRHMKEELHLWFEFVKKHYEHRLLSRYFKRGIYWNKTANIDYFKTAESLIFCTDLDYDHRYKLACLCCIESAVLEISSILAKQDQRENWANHYNNHTVDPIIVYWTSYVTHQEDVINRLVYDVNRNRDRIFSKAEYLLWYAHDTNNVYAMKYFSEQLKETVLVGSLVQAARIQISRGDTNMMCFFMSQMDKEQQLIILMEELKNMLSLLYYDIEWRSVFMAAIYPLLPYIPEDVFCALVKNILEYITNASYTSDGSGVMLKDIILAAPDHLKACLLDCKDLNRFISMLFNKMGIEFLKILLGKNNLCNLSESVYCKLLIAVVKKCSNLLHTQWQDLLCELWDYVPSSVLKSMFNDDSNSTALLILLLQMRDLKKLQELVSTASDDEIKKMFCSIAILNHIGYELLYKNSFQSIGLIEQALCDDDLKMLKQDFLNQKALYVCSNLLIQGCYNTAEMVTNWCCSAEFDILKFKEQLAYEIRHQVACTVKKDSYNLNALKIPALSRMLPWCFSNANKVTVEFSLQQEEFHELIKLISKRSDVQVSLEQIIEWWYFGNQEAISMFKYDLVCGENKELGRSVVVSLLMRCSSKSTCSSRSGLDPTKKFLQWCFNMETKGNMEDCDICRYKHELLRVCVDGSVTICELMLSLHTFTLANEFVAWCLGHSDTEIQQFKNDLFLQNNIISCFEANQSFIEELISWFAPTMKAVLEFKVKFGNRIPQQLINILDGMIKGHCVK